MSEINSDLTNKIKSGDNNSFSLVYRSYYRRMFVFANSYLKDEFVSGNIVQDVFLEFWENRSKLQPGTYLPSYLLTIKK